MKKENEKNVLNDVERREFFKKYGRLTAAVPVAMLVLMGPTQSRAADSSNEGGP